MYTQKAIINISKTELPVKNRKAIPMTHSRVWHWILENKTVNSVRNYPEMLIIMFMEQILNLFFKQNKSQK